MNGGNLLVVEPSTLKLKRCHAWLTNLIKTNMFHICFGLVPRAMEPFFSKGAIWMSKLIREWMSWDLRENLFSHLTHQIERWMGSKSWGMDLWVCDYEEDPHWFAFQLTGPRFNSPLVFEQVISWGLTFPCLRWWQNFSTFPDLRTMSSSLWRPKCAYWN